MPGSEIKNTLNIEIWNVRSLYEAGKFHNKLQILRCTVLGTIQINIDVELALFYLRNTKNTLNNTEEE